MRWNRRRMLGHLGGAASMALWPVPSADALGIVADKIKVVDYRAAGSCPQ